MKTKKIKEHELTMDELAEKLGLKGEIKSVFNVGSNVYVKERAR